MFPSHEFAMFSDAVKMISIELLTKCSKIRNVTCEDKEETLNNSNQQTYHFRHKQNNMLHSLMCSLKQILT